jgi:hypothetical protein
MPRAPLYEKARAAVAAWDGGNGSDLDHAMLELRELLREIDAARVLLDNLRLSNYDIRPDDSLPGD